jgi:hypothetical protein
VQNLAYKIEVPINEETAFRDSAKGRTVVMSAPPAASDSSLRLLLASVGDLLGDLGHEQC